MSGVNPWLIQLFFIHVGMLLILVLWYTCSLVNSDDMRLGNYWEPNQSSADAAFRQDSPFPGEGSGSCEPYFSTGAIRPAGWVSESNIDE